jgi:hypothetical protein
VNFGSDSQLKEIYGFTKCTSLCRIEFPSSFEIIGWYGFNECTSLTEIIFPSESHLKKINGFEKCTSLCRIELPSSIKIISGFSECHRLRVIRVDAGSRLKDNSGIRNGRPFLVRDDQDVKDNRRLIHLGLLVQKHRFLNSGLLIISKCQKIQFEEDERFLLLNSKLAISTFQSKLNKMSAELRS